jgi:hypothetical protein
VSSVALQVGRCCNNAIAVLALQHSPACSTDSLIGEDELAKAADDDPQQDHRCWTFSPSANR